MQNFAYSVNSRSKFSSSIKKKPRKSLTKRAGLILSVLRIFKKFKAGNFAKIIQKGKLRFNLFNTNLLKVIFVIIC